jgi:uncharacterized protein YbjT (DUF2867 family)
MRVMIAGGHGQIALRLARLLAARGDQAVGLIRNPDHDADVRAAGAEAVICDLEAVAATELAGHVAGADAVVFAAGAGPGSGAARKETVDRAASVLLADAAQLAEVRRYVQISAISAGTPSRPRADEAWAAYVRAKTAAEDDLRARDLDWTILRPGRLTNAPGTGLVALAAPRTLQGEVPRDDVAAVTVALLDTPATRAMTLELVGGHTPIAEAVSALTG